jgi:hypothetical protein
MYHCRAQVATATSRALDAISTPPWIAGEPEMQSEDVDEQFYREDSRRSSVDYVGANVLAFDWCKKTRTR